MNLAWVAFVTLVATVTTSVKADCANSGEGSCDWRGITYQNGEVFTLKGFSKCFKYKCSDRKIDIYEAGCELDNKCHPVNTNYTRKCVTYSCKSHRRDRVNHYEMVMTEYQCNIGGVCRKLNVPWDHGCASYVCVEKVVNAKTKYQVEIASAHCKDNVEGKCYEQGEMFPYEIRGRVYKKCTCNMQDNGVMKYQCFA